MDGGLVLLESGLAIPDGVGMSFVGGAGWGTAGGKPATGASAICCAASSTCMLRRALTA
jgi:hypothetical protein